MDLRKGLKLDGLFDGLIPAEDQSVGEADIAKRRKISSPTFALTRLSNLTACQIFSLGTFNITQQALRSTEYSHAIFNLRLISCHFFGSSPHKHFSLLIYPVYLLAYRRDFLVIPPFVPFSILHCGSSVYTATMCPSTEDGHSQANGVNGQSNGVNGTNGTNGRERYLISCPKKTRTKVSLQVTLAILAFKVVKTHIPIHETRISRSATSSAIFPAFKLLRAPFEKVNNLPTPFLTPRRRSRLRKLWTISEQTT